MRPRTCSKWFNSDDPQRGWYPVYIVVVLVAQTMGSRAGAKLYQEKLDKLKNGQ